MKRTGMSLLALGGIGAAALAIATRKPRSLLSATIVPAKAIVDVETAMDTIERTEQRRGVMRFAWDTPRRLASFARRRLDRSIENDTEVTLATAQPATTIPLEQQPGGGPPHR